MCEETASNAVELTDEEIEKAAGGKNNQTYTCSFFLIVVPGSKEEFFCNCFCTYGKADSTGVKQCIGGQTTASDDDIWNEYYALTANDDY